MPKQIPLGINICAMILFLYPTFLIEREDPCEEESTLQSKNLSTCALVPLNVFWFLKAVFPFSFIKLSYVTSKSVLHESTKHYTIFSQYVTSEINKSTLCDYQILTTESMQKLLANWKY